MADKLTQLEDVINNLEDQVHAINDFKSVLSEIEKLNNGTQSLRISVDDSAKVLSEIVKKLEIEISTIKVRNDELKVEINKFHEKYDSFNNKNREFEEQLTTKISDMQSYIESSFKTSQEDSKDILVKLSDTIQAIHNESNALNITFKEEVIDMVTTLDDHVKSSIRYLTNKQDKNLKTIMIIAVITGVLIIISTAINYATKM